MLRATRRVMQAQRPFVKGKKPLEAALQRGERYWREHYGARDNEGNLRSCHARPVVARRSSIRLLLWHVRWRLIILPWKYRW